MTNEEKKQKWIDALESGEYIQTRGVLANEAGFCCIGVFGVVCGIATKDEILSENILIGDISRGRIYEIFIDTFSSAHKSQAVHMNDDNFLFDFKKIAAVAKGWEVTPDDNEPLFPPSTPDDTTLDFRVEAGYI